MARFTMEWQDYMIDSGFTHDEIIERMYIIGQFSTIDDIVHFDDYDEYFIYEGTTKMDITFVSTEELVDYIHWKASFFNEKDTP